MARDAPVLLRVLRSNPILLFHSMRIFYALAIGIFSSLYLLSPIDLVPEIIFGPFGLIDDGKYSKRRCSSCNYR